MKTKLKKVGEKMIQDFNMGGMLMSIGECKKN